MRGASGWIYEREGTASAVPQGFLWKWGFSPRGRTSAARAEIVCSAIGTAKAMHSRLAILTQDWSNSANNCSVTLLSPRPMGRKISRLAWL